jgi:hypothetical protein
MADWGLLAAWDILLAFRVAKSTKDTYRVFHVVFSVAPVPKAKPMKVKCPAPL